jgi:hypothetical protein
MDHGGTLDTVDCGFIIQFRTLTANLKVGLARGWCIRLSACPEHQAIFCFISRKGGVNPAHDMPDKSARTNLP